MLVVSVLLVLSGRTGSLLAAPHHACPYLQDTGECESVNDLQQPAHLLQCRQCDYIDS